MKFSELLNSGFFASATTLLSALATSIGLIYKLRKPLARWFGLDDLRTQLAENNERISKLSVESRNEHRQMQMESLRTHILLLISNYPDNVEAIESAFTEYKELGGNSYVAHMVADWRKLHYREKSNQRRKK